MPPKTTAKSSRRRGKKIDAVQPAGRAPSPYASTALLAGALIVAGVLIAFAIRIAYSTPPPAESQQPDQTRGQLLAPGKRTSHFAPPSGPAPVTAPPAEVPAPNKLPTTDAQPQ